jgi:hypothetical protein
MNLEMPALTINDLHILRFMGAMRAIFQRVLSLRERVRVRGRNANKVAGALPS